MEKQNIMMENCRHHEAVAVRISHLEANYKDIKGLCIAILAGFLINMAVNWAQIRESRNGSQAIADTQLSNKMLNGTVIRGQ